MNEIEVIIAALSAGLAGGATATTSAAIQDCYAALRDAARRRLSRQPAELPDALLDAHAVDPEGLHDQLVRALVTARAQDDEDLIAEARRLLTLASSTEGRASKYSVQVQDVKGIQIGDCNIQTNTFG